MKSVLSIIITLSIISCSPSEEQLKDKAFKDSVLNAEKVKAMFESEKRIKDSVSKPSRSLEDIARSEAAAAKVQYDKEQAAARNESRSYTDADKQKMEEEAAVAAEQIIMEAKCDEAKAQLSDTKARLKIAYQRLASIKEFKLGRTPAEKDQQIVDQTYVIQNLEDAIEEMKKILQEKCE